jgi:hypothetical protein
MARLFVAAESVVIVRIPLVVRNLFDPGWRLSCNVWVSPLLQIIADKGKYAENAYRTENGTDTDCTTPLEILMQLL